MKKYIVGGYVRDGLMGLTPNDRDWVVVGSTPEKMEALGFYQVGGAFPVFIDELSEEYALARTEYKDGAGYKGFKVAFGVNVTLEDDLSRRDLTINAIAMDENGVIHDPFGGVNDINQKVLRHTSDAFTDDPLRVIRLARFFSRFSDFTVAPETISLAKIVTQSEDFKTLSKERVGVELIKVLKHSPAPWKFFEFLADVGGLEFYFPEIYALIGQTQPEKWHPEGDSFVHTMLVLKNAISLVTFADKTIINFAALVHDLGKGLTPKDKLPHHYGHEAAGVRPTGKMCDNLSLGNEFKKYGQFIAKFHMHVHKAMILNPKTFVNVFEETPRDDPLKYIFTLVLVSQCDARGRGPASENEETPQVMFFYNVMSAIEVVKVRNIMTPEQIEKASPENIKNTLRQARINAATSAIKRLKGNG